MRWTLPFPPLFPLALGALLVACGGDTADHSETPTPAPEAAPQAPEDPSIGLKELQEEADNVALVPSPMETQRALEAAGIDTQLSALIPQHDFDTARADTDHAAVRTGVILADALLTVKSADKDQLVARIDTIEKGMSQLGGGEDIAKTLADMKERIQADAVTRDELLKEFDELSGAVIPELEFNGNVRIVPMIQAGSWLEGAHLVAQAVKTTEDPSAADALLKQPEVVDYFVKYVHTEGKTPEAVTQKLEESLNTLKELATKTEKLSKEDLDVVTKVTGDVLALL